MLCLLPQGSPASLPAAHHAFINAQPSSCLLTMSCMHGRTPFCPLQQVIIYQKYGLRPTHKSMHVVLPLIFWHNNFLNRATHGCCSKSATIGFSRARPCPNPLSNHANRAKQLDNPWPISFAAIQPVGLGQA
jgi:hypothetical protein